MKLPLLKSAMQDLMLMQTKWKSLIDPFISNPALNTSILPNIALTTGRNVIDHKLGRTLQGWKITRQRANASVYDDQDNNPHPDLTLILVSSADVTCNIEVF